MPPKKPEIADPAPEIVPATVEAGAGVVSVVCAGETSVAAVGSAAAVVTVVSGAKPAAGMDACGAAAAVVSHEAED